MPGSLARSPGQAACRAIVSVMFPDRIMGKIHELRPRKGSGQLEAHRKGVLVLLADALATCADQGSARPESCGSCAQPSFPCNEHLEAFGHWPSFDLQPLLVLFFQPRLPGICPFVYLSPLGCRAVVCCDCVLPVRQDWLAPSVREASGALLTPCHCPGETLTDFL